MSKKKSPVWDFFEIAEDDAMKARCKLCQTFVSRGGVGKKATTSAMNNHLKTKHPNDWKDSTSSGNAEALDDDDPNKPSCSQGVKRKQQTLEACFEKRKPWDINNSRSMELHYAIGEMIAIDNQPLSIVSDIGFQRMMQKAEPRYQIPSRNYFSDNVIPDIYSKVKNIISSQIDMAEAISITSDIWTSGSNCSFISFTAHWITKEFERKSAALNVKYFPGSHTGETIGDMLQQLLTNWRMSKKMHILIRDNGPNIVKAVNDANIQNASCFIHTLQLVVNDGIDSQRTVKDVIANSRKIVGHFNHSPLACYNLQKIQEEVLHVTPKKLIQDVPTRWNSTFYMLERLLEQKKAVSLYSTEHGINNLRSEQWNTIETTLRLLQPFEEITKIISNTNSNLSEVIPTVSTLKRYLSKTGPEFFGVGTMKDTLLKGLQTRFSDICTNKMYLIATMLDPRFKGAFFGCEVIVQNATLMLEEAMQEVNDESEKKPEIPATKGDTSFSKEVHNSFWECFSEIAKNPVTTKSNCGANQSKNSEELTKYLSLPLIRRTDDPLKWWKENQFTRPTLSTLAKVYLSAPASSIDSERLFSEAGNVYEPKRNRLLPENAERLIFLHHNLPLLNYNYK